MLLNNIIAIPNLVSSTKETIWLVISQINMLLCLVNDQLDLQMIEQNKFVPKEEKFSPKNTFKFILDVFAP